ncbi:ABC transporter permease [Actinobacteria bacterium YIM 96077]|uniref:ABC transporter permease n=1 Tax=Phytoactinopolyspora halophila TaxID=1981511 RepID=A0A329R0I3_9ACTN|nr:ABC transporter permease [Phytoactinopolyspora halophila]AYY11413.1 ABC transporter permease [Actinobacteria bacterium YIM 96077]RAW18105.1 ABC transporter permease [Phytoactinopolyspora halophila]
MKRPVIRRRDRPARRLSIRDLLGEALAGVTARPSRLALTTLGTVVGIAALVSTIGLGQTASGQISERFDAASATRVVVEPGERDGPDGAVQAVQLPGDAAERVNRLAGTAAAGTFARVDVGGDRVRGVPVSDPSGSIEHDIPTVAASAGLFDAVNAMIADGRVFDDGHDERGDAVVVLGKYAAERLGISRVDTQPSIFIGERSFTVVGILDSVSARAELLDAAIMPMGTAAAVYGTGAPNAVEIRTEMGAAQLIGEQAPLAVLPNNPDLLSVDVPPPPGSLREDVSTDINAVFLALGGLALLVGGLGIATVTLLSVLERTSEIGLRRAVGATRTHVAGQFVVESVIIGFLGGLIGAAAGVLATVGVSAVRDWTPLLDYRLAIVAPLLGAMIGLVAGTYPAWRAARVEPITALRTS